MLNGIDRETVWRLLGWSSGELAVTGVRKTAERPTGFGTAQDLVLRLDDGTDVPAWFILPEGEGPFPAVLYCHAHGGNYAIGRDELLDGRPALQGPYAEDLVRLGHAVLCMDMPTFGARQEDKESALSKALLWRGRTLFGRMIAELQAGLSWLSDNPSVDRNRIATLGISMGGTHAWWLAALDERVSACVHMCCMADLGCLIDCGNHDRHGHYMTVPGLLARCTTGQLAGLAAPRRQLCCVGLQDWSSPPDCFERARTDIEMSYRASNAGNAFNVHVEPEHGHEETPAMRAAVLSFLAETGGM